MTKDCYDVPLVGLKMTHRDAENFANALDRSLKSFGNLLNKVGKALQVMRDSLKSLDKTPSNSFWYGMLGLASLGVCIYVAQNFYLRSTRRSNEVILDFGESQLATEEIQLIRISNLNETRGSNTVL